MEDPEKFTLKLRSLTIVDPLLSKEEISIAILFQNVNELENNGVPTPIQFLNPYL